MNVSYRYFVLIAGFGAMLVCGCSEGILWRGGHYVPWARNQWAEEEKVADTLFEKKRRMNESVQAALSGPPEAKEQAAGKLNEIIQNDRILLLRLHAVALLGRLDGTATIEGLKLASTDNNPDVRIAAVNAWIQQPSEVAVANLQEMIGSDTNVDVRLAATRALGNFPGSQTVSALAMALDDSDPALQVRATESLQRVTGESIGRDVQAWQSYVQQMTPAAGGQNALERSGQQRVAESPAFGRRFK